MTLGATHGKILHVDLSSGAMEIERPPDAFYLKHAGGRALVAHYLLRADAPHRDPLGPDNVLVFAPGILTGTPFPGSGRHGVGAISPLTGLIASGEVGGWWGAELKHAGFDALVIRGRAPKPVYLFVHNGKAELRSAAQLTGLSTADCQGAIRHELGDGRVRVAQCGPAGEKRVRFAAVMHDINRAAGRGGLGAVMGGKNLRAVAVRGTMKLPVFDATALKTVRDWFNSFYPEQLRWVVDMGTPISVDSLSALGGLPTRNFRDPVFEGAGSINGDSLAATLRTGRDTCYACPMRCKQVVEHHGAHEIDPRYGGPEYETLAALGSNCGVDDLVAICKANEICAAEGLDTISTGATIAFAMECFEGGFLDREDTGGLDLRFGNSEVMVRAVEQIAQRQGFGDRLAEGTARLAADLGPEAQRFAVHVKGLDPGMHEPRLKPGMGVSFAIAPVGADHMQCMHDTSYVRPGPALDRLAEIEALDPLPLADLGPEKMRVLYLDTSWRHFQDSALICMFYPYTISQTAEVLAGVTGHNWTALDVITVGERAATLCRLVNLRAGLQAADDSLPERFLTPFGEGPLAGVQIRREQIELARATYYRLMGWSEDTGIPTAERLAELEIDDMYGPPSKEVC